MVSREIRRVRCDDVLKVFMEGAKGCVFLTLTTPDVVDIGEIRKRWRDLRHWLVRQFPKGVKYVMNFELHPGGHGWHIHAVFNAYVPLKRFLAKFRSFGFGRTDVRRVNSQGVADYLTKHALKAYRGVSRREMERNPSFRLRLVNTSRGLPTLDSYVWLSEHKQTVARLVRTVGHRESFLSRLDFTRRLLFADTAALLGVRDSVDLERFAKAALTGPQAMYAYAVTFRERPVQHTQKNFLRTLDVPLTPPGRGRRRAKRA